jgi:hypothetical protein
MKHVIAAMGTLSAVVIAAGCGATEPHHRAVRPARAPDLVGVNLDDAEEQLGRLDIPYRVVTPDGEEVWVEHFWTVCDQTPAAGAKARTVELDVDRDCDDYDDEDEDW